MQSLLHVVIGYIFQAGISMSWHEIKVFNLSTGSRVGAVSERSPPTNVARVQFPDSASNVG